MGRDVIEILERMDRAALAMEHQASAIAALSTGLKLNGVVYSGTKTIGAAGVALVEARSNFASATIVPAGSDATIGTQGHNAAIPTEGPGVFVIPAGVARTVAIAGNVLVIYGTPGAKVAVTLWERVQPPAASATHPIMADVLGGAPARVAGAVVATTLAAANPARRGLTVFHENSAATILYLCFGPGASATNYTVQIAGGAYYEVPGAPYYRGIVTGLWTAATGAAQVTELV